jgi:hypothetical protein
MQLFGVIHDDHDNILAERLDAYVPAVMLALDVSRVRAMAVLEDQLEVASTVWSFRRALLDLSCVTEARLQVVPDEILKVRGVEMVPLGIRNERRGA